jgi:hypothetical protein
MLLGLNDKLEREIRFIVASNVLGFQSYIIDYKCCLKVLHLKATHL